MLTISADGLMVHSDGAWTEMKCASFHQRGVWSQHHCDDGDVPRSSGNCCILRPCGEVSCARVRWSLWPMARCGYGIWLLITFRSSGDSGLVSRVEHLWECSQRLVWGGLQESQELGQEQQGSLDGRRSGSSDIVD